MYHIPLNGVLEWCTLEDSGKIMCNLVTEDAEGNLGDDFWNHFYNIGSGEEYRISNYEFMCILLDTLGLSKPEKLFNPNWFITHNFHGHFFADSDKLEEYLHFRENVPIKDYFQRLKDQLELHFKFAGYIPKDIVAFFAKPFMKAVASTPNFGTLDWIKQNNETRICAFFGSKEAWEKIPKKWENYEIMTFDKQTSAAEKFKLDHGYDESKAEAELDIEDMKIIAVLNLKQVPPLFFLAVTGALNALFRKSHGNTTPLQKQTPSLHRYGIRVIPRMKSTDMNLMNCST